tara:strand:+ start:280 stop:519 length:240 start_codon:yes stop_codon:yes gene_type:complete
MLKLQIEKNIPIPKKGDRGSKYGFHLLKFELNDSILVEEKKVLTAFLSNANHRVKRGNSSHKYVSRQVGDSKWRIWRVK